MRSRWFDPQVGRFLSEDPIGADGGENWYGFGNSDPINTWDPLGLQGEEARKNLSGGGISCGTARSEFQDASEEFNNASQDYWHHVLEGIFKGDASPGYSNARDKMTDSFAQMNMWHKVGQIHGCWS